MTDAVLEVHALGAAASEWLALLKARQPAGWDIQTDLLLVCGAPDPILQRALRALGQARVLWLGLEDLAALDNAPPHADWRCVAETTATSAWLQELVRGWRRPLPKQVLRLRMPDIPEHPLQDQVLTQLQLLLMQRWTDDRTRDQFGQTWLEQSLTNLPLLARQQPLDRLDGLFAGRPAVLIAPGPSLDRNIDQLRALQGRAVLIAPLQTLRRLHKAGVQPDLVLVLDATDLTEPPYDFIGDLAPHELPPLVAAVHTHPNVIRRFARVFHFGGGGPVDHWMAEVDGRPLVDLKARSVALSALLLAHRWGCSPIVLVGQDLALAGDGQRYAQGAQLNAFDQAQHLYPLPGWHGGVVQSPADYAVFHQDFVRLAPQLRQVRPEVELFNCTEGGAFIPGFEHRPLREVLDGLSRSGALPPGARPLHWPPAPDAAEAPAISAHVQAYLSGQLQALGDCQRKARACTQLSRRLPAGAAGLQKLQAAEQAMREAMKRVKGFAILYRQDIDAARTAAARARHLAENLEASRRLYAVVEQGCDRLIRLLPVSAA